MPSISDATRRNWEKLHTDPDGKLTARANKQKSSKRILPVEYLIHPQNAGFALRLAGKAAEMELDASSVLLALGTCLLKKAGIWQKPHVMAALQEFMENMVLSEPEAENLIYDCLDHEPFPEDEFDLPGFVYQCLLPEGEKNMAGSYYTPPAVARNIVKDFDFSHGELFLDPCCGSGAMLIASPAAHPEQLFGTDSDPAAVLLARLNLLLKYPDLEFSPQVYCLDYLAGPRSAKADIIAAEKQLFLFSRSFDYIATNPPWGAMDHSAVLLYGKPVRESFSAFFIKACGQLKTNGIIRFLFPKSVLNIKKHSAIRRFLLENAGIIRITDYEESFTGVFTGFIDITCGAAADPERFPLCFHSRKAQEKVRMISVRSILKTENLVISLLPEEDLEILETVRAHGKYTLRNSIFALGIVTGDNRRKLSSARLEGMEPIYTGREIRSYSLLPARQFIRFDRTQLQQAAKEKFYRTPEKLVYKFVSNTLVFAYDNTGSLFLNSANILIPDVPGMSVKTVLAFLNSALFRFYYRKQFGDLKILKGNLQQLPFPEISPEEDTVFSALTDEVLKGNTSRLPEIDSLIFRLYALKKEQADRILES